MSNTEIQQLIDQAGVGGVLKLTPAKKEFQGPAIIRNPLTIEGQSCTLWAEQGPVLFVKSDGVVLNGLNIEVTGPDDQEGDDACALKVEENREVIFDHVSVRGNVAGLEEEEGEWRYPKSLRIGRLQPGHSHDFTAKLVIPVPCQFRSEIAGLMVTPAKSKGGAVKLLLRIDPLSPGTILRGTITIRTASLVRMIHVNANTPVHTTGTEIVGSGQDVYAPEDWQTLYAGDDGNITPKASSPSRKPSTKSPSQAEQGPRVPPQKPKKSPRKPGSPIVTIPDRLESSPRPSTEPSPSSLFGPKSEEGLTKSPPADEAIPADTPGSTPSSRRRRPGMESSIFGSDSASAEPASSETSEQQDTETTKPSAITEGSVVPPPPPSSSSSPSGSPSADSRDIVPPPPPKKEEELQENTKADSKSILSPPPPKSESTKSKEAEPKQPESPQQKPGKSSRRERKSGLGGAFE